MILLTKLPKDKIEYYIKMLKSFGSLSYIFSDYKVPYVSYRISENLFCLSCSAETIARLDCSIDAKIKIDNTNWGIGIKTFIHKSQTSLQKIAEFNSSRKYYSIYENKPEKTLALIEKKLGWDTYLIQNTDHWFFGQEEKLSNTIFGWIEQENNFAN